MIRYIVTAWCPSPCLRLGRTPEDLVDFPSRPISAKPASRARLCRRHFGSTSPCEVLHDKDVEKFLTIRHSRAHRDRSSRLRISFRRQVMFPRRKRLAASCPPRTRGGSRPQRAKSAHECATAASTELSLPASFSRKRSSNAQCRRGPQPR
jgi:hypothetical protein